jgi:hypothetical protein
MVGSDRTFRGEPSLKTVPIRPVLGLLTNFATGPVHVHGDDRAMLRLRPALVASVRRSQRRLSSGSLPCSPFSASDDVQSWSSPILDCLSDVLEHRAEPPKAVKEVVERSRVEPHGPDPGIAVIVRATGDRLDPGSMHIDPFGHVVELLRDVLKIVVQPAGHRSFTGPVAKFVSRPRTGRIGTVFRLGFPRKVRSDPTTFAAISKVCDRPHTYPAAVEQVRAW